MSEYIIVTDSAGDLSAELAQRLDVYVLPLSFTIRGTTLQDWPDRRDMGSREFYQLLRSGEMSTTSAVNTQQYMELLTPMLQKGIDVLILSFSSALSTTCQSSMIAAAELQEQFPDRKIYVVDTLTASVGQALLCWNASRMRGAGQDIDTVRDWCEANKGTVCGWFTVDDLMYLKRGGRVSAATAVMGTMLQIKPVLHVDDEGKLITVAKARGRKASLDVLVKRVKDTAICPEENAVFISHSDCLDDAHYVGEQIQLLCSPKELIYNDIGPVIGSHTGPGCVTVFFLGQPR